MTSQPAAGALFTIVLGELCDFSVATFWQKTERHVGGRRGQRSHKGHHARGLRALCGGRGPPPGRRRSRGRQSGQAWCRPWRRGRCLVGCWATKRGHVSLVKCCLERGWDFCLEHHVSRLHQDVWPRVPSRDRVGTLAATEGERVVEELPPTGKSRAPLIPRIPRERWVWDLFPHVPDGEPVAHRETLSADPSVFCCECVALIRQLDKLQEACDAKANFKGHGVMNATDVVEKKNGPRKAQKISVAPGVDDRRAVPGRGCRNGRCGGPRCRRAGRRSRTSCVTSVRSVTSVARFRHRLGHSAAATWFGPTCCLLLQRISTW